MAHWTPSACRNSKTSVLSLVPLDGIVQMLNDPWIWGWVGLGLVGLVILRRSPDKFMFDNPFTLTIVTILMAVGAPLWGGPIFLVIVLLVPTKQFCAHCRRAIPKSDAICRYCQHRIEVSPYELGIIGQAQPLPNEDLAALAQKYSKWDLFALPAFLIVAPVLTIGWWFVLLKVSEWRFSFIEKSVYQLLPQPLAWLLPAMFLGIVCSIYPMDGLYRLALRDKFREYQDYQRRKWPANSNPTRAAAWFFGLTTVLSLLAVVLMLDSYVLIRSNELIINPLWGFGESRYSYSDISRIRSSMKLK